MKISYKQLFYGVWAFVNHTVCQPYQKSTNQLSTKHHHPFPDFSTNIRKLEELELEQRFLKHLSNGMELN